MRRRNNRGFTLIEVMVSLGVMTIGTMAIIALLTHIMRSNAQARQLNVAMNLGQQWVDRLKEDAHTWTQAAAPSGSPTSAQVLAGTLYLRNVTSPPSTTFMSLPANTAVVSTAFDYQGQDIALPVTGTDAVAYCVAYRANWVYFGSTMRVDVRVFWPREGTSANIANDWPNCGGAQNRLDIPAGTTGSLQGQYHVLYMPTVIGVTPVPR
jgi:prepilin-type N-terminal cleavage/methylation domain-containing protein